MRALILLIDFSLLIWSLKTNAAPVETTNCVYSAAELHVLGLTYTGDRSTTVNNRTCQIWSVNTPHSKDQLHSSPGNHNKCRNPKKDANIGPWCYTTDPRVRWEPCFKICPAPIEGTTTTSTVLPPISGTTTTSAGQTTPSTTTTTTTVTTTTPSTTTKFPPIEGTTTTTPGLPPIEGTTTVVTDPPIEGTTTIFHPIEGTTTTVTTAWPIEGTTSTTPGQTTPTSTTTTTTFTTTTPTTTTQFPPIEGTTTTTPAIPPIEGTTTTVPTSPPIEGTTSTLPTTRTPPRSTTPERCEDKADNCSENENDCGTAAWMKVACRETCGYCE